MQTRLFFSFEDDFFALGSADAEVDVVEGCRLNIEEGSGAFQFEKLAFVRDLEVEPEREALFRFEMEFALAFEQLSFGYFDAEFFFEVLGCVEDVGELVLCEGGVVYRDRFGRGYFYIRQIGIFRVFVHGDADFIDEEFFLFGFGRVVRIYVGADDVGDDGIVTEGDVYRVRELFFDDYCLQLRMRLFERRGDGVGICEENVFSLERFEGLFEGVVG